MKRLWTPRLHSLVPAAQAQAGLILGLLLFGLAACSTFTAPEPESENPEPVSASASLPDLGPAPELTNEVWLNVDAPLRLADLRGKVVAIDMWTFG
jgi:hypothetical protein